MTPLEAHVAAVNLANKTANTWFLILRNFFMPYVGKKIIKGDGNLLESLNTKIKDLNLLNGAALYIFRSVSSYNLCYVVKACKSDGGHAHYHETYLYIGELEGQFLKNLAPTVQHFKDDYCAEEIERLREEYQKAKKICDDAQSALHPFGEHTR